MVKVSLVAALAAGCALSTTAIAQIRVVAWNISNYAGGRTADIQTVVYGQFEGRSMSPDVIAAQEILSNAADAAFLAALNTAPGSPGDWARAPFVDGPDTDAGLYYRTSKLTLIGNRTWVVAAGSSDAANQPRNTYRYDLVPVGYAAAPAAMSLYSVHMKAGNASSDNSRRLVESTRIRNNAAGQDTNGAGTAKPAGYQFMVLGDMNMQSSSQTSYVKFVGSEANNLGRFFDPILTPGSWNNNGAFRFVHTQDPIGAGGMDDRHDQILVGAGLLDEVGLDYIGNEDIPYSTSTWNDPNHSYRVWGNDGSSFDAAMTTVGNTMVGPAIATAIRNCAGSGGHIPVFLDLRVPAKVGSDLVIDFGTVEVGAAATETLTVFNAGDVALFTGGGISTLNYSLAASSGFAAPGGVFSDAAGGGFNGHTITMNTATPGNKAGTITIASDDPDQPARVVTVLGTVEEPAPACPADFNGDGFLDFFDYDDYVLCYEENVCPDGKTADHNGDGFVDFFDYDDFVLDYETGC
jgi:hypothetical protein